MKLLHSIIVLIFVTMILTNISYAQDTVREQALNAIKQAEYDIQEMIEAGLSVNSVNDTLINAKQALERADFAELIRQNASGELADKARKVLEGLDYEGFTYYEVIKYTDDIASKKQQAFAFSYSIRALEIRIDDYREQNVDTLEAESIYENIIISFNKERYGEVEQLLSQANLNLDEKRAELTTLNVMINSSRNFIEKNWPELLIIIIIIVICALFGWKKYNKRKISKKLIYLKIEKDTLIKLIKKAQIGRFKEAKISKYVFDIKMDKYNKKLNEIKEKIPVLEAILKKKKK